MDSFSLHAQLANDTAAVGDLPLSSVLVNKDANFPWLMLVPRRAGITEIVDLDHAEQTQLMNEIAQVSRALKAVTRCDKLNIAAIGNVVPQLHVHVVARSRSDAAWPRPVWGAVPARAYEPTEMERFVAAIRRELELA